MVKASEMTVFRDFWGLKHQIWDFMGFRVVGVKNDKNW
jgi:hypothetical protein